MSRPRIEIVGLGPAGIDYVTDHTRQRIAAHRHRFLRTDRHPSAAVVPDAIALDHHYEIADTFDETYRTIVEELVAAAHEHGEILYAVPGSPLILERTVRDLLVDDRVECVVQPAMSFLDLVWPALGIDPVEANVTLVDGHDFATAAAGASGPLLVAHCHADWILSSIKLSTEDTDDLTNDDVDVILLHHLGLPDQVVTTVPWSEMDRTVVADHLTCLYIPRLRVPVGRELVAFHELARRLRRECPWDREQTHRSLTKYLLEETYEVVDALDALDPDDPRTDEQLLEELGDLLYQIEFHAAIAEQEGRFTMA
ncbi:MAG: MazG nucleotide pyrophosphohydrolase domain-containing protein, partial [Actinomycetota bacterium]